MLLHRILPHCMDDKLAFNTSIQRAHHREFTPLSLYRSLNQSISHAKRFRYAREPHQWITNEPICMLTYWENGSFCRQISSGMREVQLSDKRNSNAERTNTSHVA